MSVFSYHYIYGHNCYNDEDCKKEFEQDFLGRSGYSHIIKKIEYYLAYVSLLADSQEKFLLIRDSPLLSSFSRIKKRAQVKWKYEVIANDFEGIGIDKGFVHAKEPHVLMYAADLYSVIDIPEDVFEEDYTSLTVFAISPGRVKLLEEFLNSEAKPQLENFLQDDEVFFNIISGKNYGYFDSVLVKSKTDIWDKICRYNTMMRKRGYQIDEYCNDMLKKDLGEEKKLS